MTIKKLSEQTGADFALMGRIMRGLAAIDAIEEVGDKSYVPSKIPRAFTTIKGIYGTSLL